MELKDGTGTGYRLRVDDEHMAHVLAACTNNQHHANDAHGESYVLDLDAVTAGGNADVFIYMLNSNDLDMHISSVTLWTAEAQDDDNVEAVIGHTLTSVANNTAVTPNNCNGGSGLSAVGTFYKSDGTAGGITTLAGGDIVGRCKFSKTPYKWSKESHWIVPKNGTFCLKTEKSNVYRGYISFYFHNNQWR